MVKFGLLQLEMSTVVHLFYNCSISVSKTRSLSQQREQPSVINLNPVDRYAFSKQCPSRLPICGANVWQIESFDIFERPPHYHDIFPISTPSGRSMGVATLVKVRLRLTFIV